VPALLLGWAEQLRLKRSLSATATSTREGVGRVSWHHVCPCFRQDRFGLANHANRVMNAHPSGFETVSRTACTLNVHPSVFTNTRIVNDVRVALHRDHRIKRPELIAVSVDEIGTVVLSGAVGSLPQHRAAVHDARQIDGVFEVIADDLKVHPPVGEQRADDELRAAAIKELISDSRIRSEQIHVKVSFGRVTLSGYVRGEAECAAAAEDVARVSGVLGVSNQLEIR
jgi:osmotically-inducible protein OsmY